MSNAARHLRVVEHVIDEDGELAGCPNCADVMAECEVWERRVVKLEQDLRKALEDKDAKLARDKYFPAAIGLIQEWKTECGHPKSSETDPKRVRLALSVIKRYSSDPQGRAKLSMVIQQAKHLAFVGDDGFKFDEFGRIFGSSDEIEARAKKWYLHARRCGLPLLPEQAA